MIPKESTRISKLLSAVLRHSPEIIGITLDENRWTDVNSIIEKVDILDMSLLEHIVESNSMKLFAFNEDKTKIRANQVHSLDVDVELKEDVPPYYLYHSAPDNDMIQIEKSGLLKTSGDYVQLSIDEQDAAIRGHLSSPRHSEVNMIPIRSLDMYKAGFKFYLTKNMMWLTDHVPAEYINFFKKL